ncbi:hypothetical protein HPB50_025766 [Hyalomma asiaticum]|uniref:Uncharacterized protein n=1 Tax=Hyalomma asiaticum TaxID=266040 RepID=A0ACB7RQF7_HYAAI|nr:hypothetical protein HPB50_025766 [Hyalomma asiaticum]
MKLGIVVDRQAPERWGKPHSKRAATGRKRGLAWRATAAAGKGNRLYEWRIRLVHHNYNTTSNNAINDSNNDTNNGAAPENPSLLALIGHSRLEARSNAREFYQRVLGTPFKVGIAVFAVEPKETSLSDCQLNEEPGDPCTRPDLPCRSVFVGNSTYGKGCSGCVCKQGFRRSVFGECVAEGDCRTCWSDPFSDYSSCGGCPPVCGEVYPAPCPRTCSSGCYCIDGFVRSSIDGGSCVPVTSCPPKCLGGNMVFVAHKSCYPDRCPAGQDYGPYDCGGPGCECSQGYRLLDSLTCVAKCPNT